jgi:hypothetical protein
MSLTMGSLLKILWRTVILDNSAYQEWRERPNVFLRGIVLIVIVSLVAGLITLAVNLVNQIEPVNVANIQKEIDRWYGYQSQFAPFSQSPEERQFVDDTLKLIVPMVRDIAQVSAPLPRGLVGFFHAFGGWLTRALAAIAGWLFYGTLVLLFANLLGGSAKLPVFLGTVAVYIVPGLLAVLSPVPCLGPLLVLIGTIWSIVVYVKATSVTAGLDAGRAVLAVFAPFLVLVLLSGLLMALFILWLVIIF